MKRANNRLQPVHNLRATIIGAAATVCATVPFAAFAGSISDAPGDVSPQFCEVREYQCTSSAQATAVLQSCYAAYNPGIKKSFCTDQTCNGWSVVGTLPWLIQKPEGIELYLYGHGGLMPNLKLPAGVSLSSSRGTYVKLDTDTYPIRFHGYKDALCRWHEYCQPDGSGVRSSKLTALNAMAPIPKESVQQLCKFSSAFLGQNKKTQCVFKYNPELGKLCGG